ncbi:MAG: class IV adenylate cyclase [Spirochaetia bacterium]|nr:MAG: class IV adenylate cyclase [Spirochaetia bacterium]
MANNNIEIEIQVNVENPKPLIEFLEKSGNFQSEKHQVDEYFSPAHRDFLGVRPAKEWLRLRDADGKYSINYKNWHFDENGKSHHCDEFETKIESIDQARKIFSALNFKSLVVVDKLRKIWAYKDYEVATDSVRSLGDFVEIEYIGKDESIDPKKVTEEMVEFLKKVGCGKITRNYVGYPFLMLFPEEAKYEIQ